MNQVARGVSVLALAVVAATACGDGTGPKVATPSELAYLANTYVRAGYTFVNQDIFLVSEDGGDGRPIALTPDTEGEFTWSPDGARLAVVRAGGIDLVDVESGRATMLMPGALWTRHLRWAPDGRRIAAIRADSIVLVDVATGAVTVLGPDYDDPEWSPDGTRLLAADSNARLVLIDTLGHRLGELIDSSGPWRSARWSPDGRSVAVARAADSVSWWVTDVWVIDVATGALSQNLGSGTCPAWSPDGTRIAFMQDALLTIARPDGSDRRSAVTDGLSCPAWSPTGQRLALTEWTTPTYLSVVVRDAADPDVRAIVAHGGHGPRWRPARH